MKRVLRIIGKVLLVTVLLAAVGLTIAHFAWKYSGSSQWELHRDKKGVAIYTMKVPGETKLRFKVITRIRTTMDRIVAGMTDTSTEGCQHFVTGCISGKVFKQFDEKELRYVQAYRIAFRERRWLKDVAFVNNVQFVRDPKTKTLTVTLDAVPSLIPKDDCCTPFTELHNVWQFTPLENGLIHMQVIEHDNPPFPYVMYNRALKINHTWMRVNSEKAFNKEKYANARFAFLRD
jgi:ribosome-associated toxin RatA of RatAB toxin-antitoxin module